jgi:hypothetical protein
VILRVTFPLTVYLGPRAWSTMSAPDSVREPRRLLADGHSGEVEMRSRSCEPGRRVAQEFAKLSQTGAETLSIQSGRNYLSVNHLEATNPAFRHLNREFVSSAANVAGPNDRVCLAAQPVEK